MYDSQNIAWQQDGNTQNTGEWRVPASRLTSGTATLSH